MGWGRFFLLGDLGQQLDIHDRERDMQDLRQQIGSQDDRDQHQDSQIAKLHVENQDLKLYLTSLVRLLISKNALTQQEVEQMVQLVERTAPKPM
jgi:hypothetical protein